MEILIAGEGGLVLAAVLLISAAVQGFNASQDRSATGERPATTGEEVPGDDPAEGGNNPRKTRGQRTDPQGGQLEGTTREGRAPDVKPQEADRTSVKSRTAPSSTPQGTDRNVQGLEGGSENLPNVESPPPDQSNIFTDAFGRISQVFSQTSDSPIGGSIRNIIGSRTGQAGLAALTASLSDLGAKGKASKLSGPRSSPGQSSNAQKAALRRLRDQASGGRLNTTLLGRPGPRGPSRVGASLISGSRNA